MLGIKEVPNAFLPRKSSCAQIENEPDYVKFSKVILSAEKNNYKDDQLYHPSALLLDKKAKLTYHNSPNLVGGLFHPMGNATLGLSARATTQLQKPPIFGEQIRTTSPVLSNISIDGSTKNDQPMQSDFARKVMMEEWKLPVPRDRSMSSHT